jgi:hypothetical protein
MKTMCAKEVITKGRIEVIEYVTLETSKDPVNLTELQSSIDLVSADSK